MVNWRDLETKVDKRISSALGEPLLFKPVVEKDNWGNAKAGDLRQPVTVIGALLERGADIEFFDGDRRISQFNSRTIVAEAHASLDRASFGESNLPRKGDTLEKSQNPPVVYQIVDVIFDGNARIACPLTRLP